jgi:hypothetical protein
VLADSAASPCVAITPMSWSSRSGAVACSSTRMRAAEGTARFRILTTEGHTWIHADPPATGRSAKTGRNPHVGVRVQVVPCAVPDGLVLLAVRSPASGTRHVARGHGETNPLHRVRMRRKGARALQVAQRLDASGAQPDLVFARDRREAAPASIEFDGNDRKRIHQFPRVSKTKDQRPYRRIRSRDL